MIINSHLNSINRIINSNEECSECEYQYPRIEPSPTSPLFLSVDGIDSGP